MTDLLRVSARTKRLVRYVATVEERSMADVVDAAVREYLDAHHDEIEAGVAHAFEVLLESQA